MQLQGWLFDLYPLDSSMILWIKGEDGLLHRFEDPFRPRFYAQGSREDLLALFCSLQRERLVIGYQWALKREFWSGHEVEVMEIEMANPEHYAQLLHLWGVGDGRGDRTGSIGQDPGSADGPHLSGNSHHLDATRPGLSGRHSHSPEERGA